MEINYQIGERSFPVSINGVSVPIHTKGFRFSNWQEFEDNIRKQVLGCLGDDFYGDVSVPYHPPAVRKMASRAMLYLQGTQNPEVTDVHVTLFTGGDTDEFLQDTGAIGFPSDPSEELKTTSNGVSGGGISGFELMQ